VARILSRLDYILVTALLSLHEIIRLLSLDFFVNRCDNLQLYALDTAMRLGKDCCRIFYEDTRSTRTQELVNDYNREKYYFSTMVEKEKRQAG
jgi:hypothetical protein